MNKLKKIGVVAMLLSPAVYLGFVWNKLPERVPMHYNFKGEIDRYGNKVELWAVIGILFILNVGVYLLMTNIHKIDPKKKYGESGLQKINQLAFILVMFLSVVSIYIVYNTLPINKGFSIRFVFGSIGALFAVLGNYMYSAKPNYFFGVRTPWTLKNEDNWKHTHRFAGKLWFCAGMLLVLAAFVFNKTLLVITFVTIATIIALMPIISSYLFYKQQKKNS